MGLNSNRFSINKEAYTKTKVKYINPEKIEFLKVNNKHKESRYVLFSDKININYIILGPIEDSYFLSSVQDLCKVSYNINKIK